MKVIICSSVDLDQVVYDARTLFTVHKALVHAGRPSHPQDPHRDPTGSHPGRPKDYGGHWRLAQKLQISKGKPRIDTTHSRMSALPLERFHFPMWCYDDLGIIPSDTDSVLSLSLCSCCFTGTLFRAILWRTWAVPETRRPRRRCCCWNTMSLICPSPRTCSASYPACRGPSLRTWVPPFTSRGNFRDGSCVPSYWLILYGFVWTSRLIVASRPDRTWTGGRTFAICVCAVWIPPGAQILTTLCTVENLRMET